MPRYLLESYLAASPAKARESTARARRTAELDLDVHYVRMTFLATDETILHLFEAPSATALARAARRADLPFDRIVEAVEGPDEQLARGTSSTTPDKGDHR
jgi:hypothetical protein